MHTFALLGEALRDEKQRQTQPGPIMLVTGLIFLSPTDIIIIILSG